jgi:hemolysin D
VSGGINPSFDSSSLLTDRLITRSKARAQSADRDIALETASRAGAQMASVGSGGLRSRAEARVRILADLARAEAEAKQRREELAKASQRSSLQRLVSSVDGTVTQLAVHTIGGVVEAGRPLMVVVPNGGNLIVEAKLLNKDAGFVRIGQSVAVKLEAFPFTRHGTINGTIETIGSDAANDEKLGPVFPMRVRLECGTKGSAALCSQIGPGMAATADVRTGRRSILSYLMSPIDEARLEAGRER